LPDSTLTIILVCVFTAWTNAPRNGVPSGPLTVPVTVAASPVIEKAIAKMAIAIVLDIMRITSPVPAVQSLEISLPDLL
jgi:hypothetical protein